MTAKLTPLDLTLLAGDDELRPYLATSGGVARDLSTYELHLRFWQAPEFSELIEDIELQDDSDGNDWSQGEIVLVVPRATTVILPPVCGYDVVAVLAGAYETLFWGTCHTMRKCAAAV